MILPEERNQITDEADNNIEKQESIENIDKLDYINKEIFNNLKFYNISKNKFDINSKIFKLISKRLSKNYVEFKSKEIDKIFLDLPEHKFSKSFELKMKILIEHLNIKEKKRAKRVFLLKRLTVFTTIVFVTVGFSNNSDVEAFKFKIYSFFVENKPLYTKLTIKDLEKVSNVLRKQSDLEYIYMVDEIPKDYYITDVTSDKSKIFTTFYNGVINKEFRFFQENKPTTNIIFDNENSISKEIKVGVYNGYINFNKNKTNTLIWSNNDYSFKLSGYLTENELLSIAKSLYKLKK